MEALPLAALHRRIQDRVAAAVASTVLMKARPARRWLPGRAGVEAEPAHPQQRGTHHGQRQAVRRHGFLAVADALAHQVGTHQTGHTGVDVHHGAAGEVQRAVLGQQAAAPHHVRHGQVAEGEPQHENSSTAENLARSAKAPTISATVMAAKVAWKATNTYSGMVGSSDRRCRA
jgi:hypothetical protein